jgi:multimeric flavodoxin WrbA
MANIILLNGSPREKGNTSYLSEVFKNKLIEYGHNVRVLFLKDYHIKPCQGCFWCYQGFPLECVQDDDMNSLYPLILNADVIVFSSPIYWFNYSAQLKLFVDRLVALHVKGGHALDGKKFASVFVYGDRDSEASGVFTAIESIEKMISYFKGDYLGVLHGTGGDNLTVPENKKLLGALQELATKL